MACPKSFVTAQSLAWLDEYGAWRRNPHADYASMEAKKLDAFFLIEEEIAAQTTDR